MVFGTQAHSKPLTGFYGVRNLEEQFDYRSVTSAMRRRAKWSQYQAFVLLLVTLSIATYAAIYFATEDRSIAISVDLEGANVQEQINISVPEENIFDFLVDAILRLGAVLLAVYLISLLFSLVRYRIKLAEDLEQRADMIELCYNDEEKLKLISSLVAVQGTDIGSMPDHPYGKFADAIKEIAGKLPGS